MCVCVCVWASNMLMQRHLSLQHFFSGTNSPACVHASVVWSCWGFRWSSTKKHLPASLQYYISEARTDGATIRTGSDAAFMDHVPLETTFHWDYSGTHCTVHRVVRALQGSLSDIFSWVTTAAWEINTTWVEAYVVTSASTLPSCDKWINKTSHNISRTFLNTRAAAKSDVIHSLIHSFIPSHEHTLVSCAIFLLIFRCRSCVYSSVTLPS